MSTRGRQKFNENRGMGRKIAENRVRERDGPENCREQDKHV